MLWTVWDAGMRGGSVRKQQQSGKVHDFTECMDMASIVCIPTYLGLHESRL